MVAKLGDLLAMLAAGNYSDAYDVLLHEIKPKLTGLKTDEHEVPWGNGVFNNPWVTGAALQDQFRLWANGLLQGIEDINACGERYSLSQAKNALESGKMKCSCGNDLTRVAQTLLDARGE